MARSMVPRPFLLHLRDDVLVAIVEDGAVEAEPVRRSRRAAARSGVGGGRTMAKGL